MKDRVLSGMRPTGRLHLGNYLGALKNWVALQNDHKCFYFIADWHALTTEYADTSEMEEWSVEIVLDWLAAGLDPDKSVLFLQSQLLEHAELALIFSMLTPVSWLERNPTYKDLKHELKGKDLATHGFLGYPVLQAADILIYKPRFVPVGVDQLPHLELTREIARRFNNFYGEIFPEPQPKMTPTPKVPGVDGRKMSKSYGNAIYLADSMEEVWEKIRPMVTDTNRKRKTDPGDPALCPVFALHEAFTPESLHGEITGNCKGARWGCIECKRLLMEHLRGEMEPIYERRVSWESRRGEVTGIIREGTSRAREIAQTTMEEVRNAVRFWRLQ